MACVYQIYGYLTHLQNVTAHHTHIAILRVFFRDYPGKPMPEEIFFWTSWCKGR